MRNYTFSLPDELVGRLKQHVHVLNISTNAAVRDALEEYVKKLEKQKIKNEMKIAIQDPIFIADLNISMQKLSDGSHDI